MKNLLVFTDLDGTLLNHHDYSWEAARPALERLDKLGIPLILNTSKTYEEVRQIRDDLDNHHPFIVENGSAVYTPTSYFNPQSKTSEDNFEIVYFGPVRRRILKIIKQLREEHGYKFIGFDELTDEQLSNLTGLSLDQASRARQRDCSEPLVWQDSEAALQTFQEELKGEELKVLKGGRFTHVMGPTDKSNGISWLVQRYSDVEPRHEYQSVGLGDSPNDRGMLEVVDIPIVIEMASGETLAIDTDKPVRVPGMQGPEGWNLAMMQLLDEIQREDG